MKRVARPHWRKGGEEAAIKMVGFFKRTLMAIFLWLVEFRVLLQTGLAIRGLKIEKQAGEAERRMVIRWQEKQGGNDARMAIGCH